MQSVLHYVPDVIKTNVSGVAARCNNWYNAAHEKYTTFEGHVVSYFDSKYSPKTAQIAAKVIRSIPETLFYAAMFFNVARIPVGIFLATKAIYALTPMIRTACTKGFGNEAMDPARSESRTRFKQAFEKFFPALMTAAAVCSAASGVFAILRLNYSLLLYSGFFALLSYTGYKAMTLASPASADAAAPAAAPPGTPGASEVSGASSRTSAGSEVPGAAPGTPGAPEVSGASSSTSAGSAVPGASPSTPATTPAAEAASQTAQ